MDAFFRNLKTYRKVSNSLYNISLFQEMHDFTLHHKFEIGGRRKSFDFFGKTREDFYRVKPSTTVPSPPPRSPTPSPPASPTPPSSPEPPEPSTLQPPSATLPAPPTTVEPGTVHVTFRLPDGSRHTGVFSQKDGICSELYRWLETYLGMFKHDIWTAFPRTLVKDDEATLEGVVGRASRAVLMVSEKDDD